MQACITSALLHCDTSLWTNIHTDNFSRERLEWSINVQMAPNQALRNNSGISIPIQLSYVIAKKSITSFIQRPQEFFDRSRSISTNKKLGTAQVRAARKGRNIINGDHLFVKKLWLFRQKFGMITFFLLKIWSHSPENLGVTLCFNIYCLRKSLAQKLLVLAFTKNHFHQ